MLSNIAYRTGRRLQWDDARERFVGDRDADKYLARALQALRAVTDWELGTRTRDAGFGIRDSAWGLRLGLGNREWGRTCAGTAGRSA